jgi:hypothetical protein
MAHKYDRLTEFLRDSPAKPGEEVSFSIWQIRLILGGSSSGRSAPWPLPDSALFYPKAWWTNRARVRTHRRAWIDAGFYVVHVDVVRDDEGNNTPDTSITFKKQSPPVSKGNSEIRVPMAPLPASPMGGLH